MNWWQAKDLRFKIALGISLSMLIVMGIAFFFIAQYIQSQLWQRETQAAENLNAIAATLIEDAMMAGQEEIIHDAMAALGNSIGGKIDSIAIYNEQFELTAYATGFPGGRNIAVNSLDVSVADPTCWECHQLPPEDRPTMTTITLEGQKVIRNVVPLYNNTRCQTCHGTDKSVLGDSILDIRIDSYQNTVTTVTIGFGIGILITIILVALVLYQLLKRIVISPIDDLVKVTHSVVRGNLEQRVNVRSNDEIGQLGLSFNSMTQQIRNILGELEQRVTDRTRTLEQRTAYLEASADVSRSAATVLEPDVLIEDVVDLIRDRFDLYYVGLFIVDKGNEWCVLKAGTGDAGKAMLEKGHRIKVGEGMIGWCVANAQARIALDSGLDAVRFDNPLLPYTRSEGALPLRSRGKVLGALTVQSDKPIAFDENIITVLQTMADQIAVALDNAELITRAEESLEAERLAYGELSREAWKKLLDQSEFGVIASDTLNIQKTTSDWSAQMQETATNGQISQFGEDTIHFPITLRGQTLGVVRLRKSQGTDGWGDDEIDLLKALVNQLESSLEAARLYNDIQIQAGRERLTHEITNRLHRALDIDTLMQTFLQEISSALGATGGFVQLIPDTDLAMPADSNPTS